jgi:hypothetical protein
MRIPILEFTYRGKHSIFEVSGNTCIVACLHELVKTSFELLDNAGVPVSESVYFR